jgi:hypothetical protein
MPGITAVECEDYDGRQARSIERGQAEHRCGSAASRAESLWLSGQHSTFIGAAPLRGGAAVRRKRTFPGEAELHRTEGGKAAVRRASKNDSMTLASTTISFVAAIPQFAVPDLVRTARQMKSGKSTGPLFEWVPPPPYLKWRLSGPAFRAMLVEFALGFLGAAVIYVALRSVALALLFLLFATILGLAARWIIPRTNAGGFRAMEEVLEIRAASKRQWVAYRDLSSCVVQHRRHEGVGFALLGLRFSAEYNRARKWYEPRKLNPIPVGEGEELEQVLQVLKKKGIDVIYADGARE